MAKTGLQLKLYKTIDEILWKDWDPIGLYIPGFEEGRDEYQSYLPKVYEMVKSNKSQEEIADYLINVETERMGYVENKERKECCIKVALLILEARDNFLR